MSRLNFPDPSGFPGGVIPKGHECVRNDLLFKYDGNGWTKQILSGNISLDLSTIDNNRLLPITSTDKDNSRLKVEDGSWKVDETLDGGTY